MTRRTSQLHRINARLDAERATVFRAWRVTPLGTYPIDIGQPDTFAEAENEAQLGTGLSHKDTLLIHERDDAKRAGTLRSYSVVKKAAVWRRNELTGLSERFEPLAIKPGFLLPIYQFEPTLPFDAFRDNATGVDLTLVEAAGRGLR